MKNQKTSIGKKLLVVLSLLICFYAAAEQLFATDHRPLLMETAGFAPEDSPGDSPGDSPKAQKLARSQGFETSGKSETAEEILPFLEEDEIVAFYGESLPQTEASPDPNRTALPVEELTLTDGTRVGDFYVKDTSAAGLDLNEVLTRSPGFRLEGNGEVEVLLYHTHTTEAYLPDYTGFYYTDMETRTQNQTQSVVAVGEAVKRRLEQAGIGVVHDTTVNDSMYSGSYARSWELLERNLEAYPGIKVTIDIHRDSMTNAEGVKYKPTAEVGGRKAAQLMILTGCDANGEWGDFPDWAENLTFALRVQQKLTQTAPTLVRPLNFGDHKYNMNATTGSLLVEVGTEVNTVAEATYSGELLGDALAELFETPW